MKSTPSSARRTARSVLIAVSPTYWPTRPGRPTSTRWPRRRSPIEWYISARSRATVVLPVPGLPRKTRCCEVATSGRPCSARRPCTWRNATSARTCSFTVSRPTRASSSAWSSSMLRGGGGLRRRSSWSAIQSEPPSPPPTRSRSVSTRRPCWRSSSGFLGIATATYPLQEGPARPGPPCERDASVGRDALLTHGQAGDTADRGQRAVSVDVEAVDRAREPGLRVEIPTGHGQIDAAQVGRSGYGSEQGRRAVWPDRERAHVVAARVRDVVEASGADDPAQRCLPVGRRARIAQRAV